jgi:hypothetical protein
MSRTERATASKRSRALTAVGLRTFEEQVPLVERVIRPGELNRTAPVLLAEFRQAVRAC